MHPEMLLSTVIFTLLPHTLTSAALTNNTYVGWTAEPVGRGTLGILIPCTIALGLCIWTALHLNVEPVSVDTGMSSPATFRFLGKCLWAFTALVAPELALSIALHQFLVARRYCELVNATPGRRMPVAIAFYAVMGALPTE
jgi:hypothetical protein